MAKTTKRPPRDTRENREPTARSAANQKSNASSAEQPAPVDESLVTLAEDLGKVLGTAQRRMTSWLGERQEIATQLVQIRDTANQYLRDLTAGGASLAAAIERGRRSAPKPPSTGSETPASDPGEKPPTRKRRKP